MYWPGAAWVAGVVAALTEHCATVSFAPHPSRGLDAQ